MRREIMSFFVILEVILSYGNLGVVQVLVKTFISNMFGSVLWCDFTKAVYHKLCVSYDNVFRHV